MVFDLFIITLCKAQTCLQESINALIISHICINVREDNYRNCNVKGHYAIKAIYMNYNVKQKLNQIIYENIYLV